jgi:hypothetical protein
MNVSTSGSLFDRLSHQRRGSSTQPLSGANHNFGVEVLRLWFWNRECACRAAAAPPG